MPRVLRAFLVLSSCALLLSCSSSSTGEEPPTRNDDRWAPTTTPYDPECASDCEVLIDGEFGHVGAVTLSFNPDVDDPVAQWGDCIQSFRECIDSGGDGLSCSESSACPEDCKREYSNRVATGSELEAQVLAFRDVYVAEDAPCLPSFEEASP